jgi:hypothetical protein
MGDFIDYTLRMAVVAALYAIVTAALIERGLPAAVAAGTGVVAVLGGFLVRIDMRLDHEDDGLSLEEAVENMARAYAVRRQQQLNDEGSWEGRSEPLDPELAWTDEGSSELWRDGIRDRMREQLRDAGLIEEGLRG